MGRAGRLGLISLALAGMTWAMAGAQEAPPPRGASILVVDQDDLFTESAFGRRIRAELEEASRALAAENRQIEAQLTAEERDLTDRRATMPIEAFRQLAADFDAKVVRIRGEREAKGRELNRRVDQERKRFLDAILPVLEQVVNETGALAVIDSRMVLLSNQSINVTRDVITRLDATLGDGTTAAPTPGSPPATDTQP